MWIFNAFVCCSFIRLYTNSQSRVDSWSRRLVENMENSWLHAKAVKNIPSYDICTIDITSIWRSIVMREFSPVCAAAAICSAECIICWVSVLLLPGSMSQLCFQLSMHSLFMHALSLYFQLSIRNLLSCRAHGLLDQSTARITLCVSACSCQLSSSIVHISILWYDCSMRSYTLLIWCRVKSCTCMCQACWGSAHNVVHSSQPISNP